MSVMGHVDYIVTSQARENWCLLGGTLSDVQRAADDAAYELRYAKKGKGDPIVERVAQLATRFAQYADGIRGTSEYDNERFHWNNAISYSTCLLSQCEDAFSGPHGERLDREYLGLAETLRRAATLAANLYGQRQYLEGEEEHMALILCEAVMVLHWLFNSYVGAGKVSEDLAPRLDDIIAEIDYRKRGIIAA